MSLPRAGAETGETPLEGSWGAGERKVGPVVGGHECGVRRLGGPVGGGGRRACVGVAFGGVCEVGPGGV